MSPWNEPLPRLPLLQDSTLRQAADTVGASPWNARAAACFLEAARRLPLQSFDLPAHERELLEELGPRGACSSADVDELAALPAATEKMLIVELPTAWTELDRVVERLGRTTLTIANVGRQDPIALARLCREAGRWGCRGLVLSDERGEVGPHGVGYLVRFVRRLSDEMGVALELTWAGSNRYGTGLAQAWEAVEVGADRVRGCALGLGRTGSVPLDQLLLNLGQDRQSLADYCRQAAQSVGLVATAHYPVWADEAAIGPTSKASDVRRWLERNGLAAGHRMVERLLNLARRSRHALSDLQLLEAAGVRF